MANPRIRTIAFPFKQGDLSFPQEATDADAIIASVIQIITTAKGERIMRPNFGCDAFSFVFEHFGEEFRIRVEREVRQSLSTWEPRIRVNSVNVETDSVTEPGQMTIVVTYTILSTGDQITTAVAGGI